MTERDLIKKVIVGLGAADRALNDNNHTVYAEQMSACLDLLLEELVGAPPAAQGNPYKKFNPEQVLQEIAIAIKHRTISTTHRWSIVYYHTRLTCVPTNVTIPPEIILHEFTDNMVNAGFTTIYWNQLKQNVTKLYKELHK